MNYSEPLRCGFMFVDAAGMPGQLSRILTTASIPMLARTEPHATASPGRSRLARRMPSLICFGDLGFRGRIITMIQGKI